MLSVQDRPQNLTECKYTVRSTSWFTQAQAQMTTVTLRHLYHLATYFSTSQHPPSFCITNSIDTKTEADGMSPTTSFTCHAGHLGYRPYITLQKILGTLRRLHCATPTKGKTPRH
jgi:hypothetical protein